MRDQEIGVKVANRRLPPHRITIPCIAPVDVIFFLFADKVIQNRISGQVKVIARPVAATMPVVLSRWLFQLDFPFVFVVIGAELQKPAAHA